MGLVARLPEEVSGSILQGSFLTLSVVLVTLIAATGVLLRIFLKGPLDQLGAIVHAYDIQRATPGVVDRANLAAEFEPFVDLLERMRDQIRSQMAALRQAEAKYRTIFENAVEGIFQTTPGGRLLTANPALASMLGYDTPEAVVASVDNIATQCYAQEECRDDMLAMIQREGRIVGYETELIRKDGTVFWAAINARAIRDETGRIS
jgi:PAS domain S-box-containing protein